MWLDQTIKTKGSQVPGEVIPPEANSLYYVGCVKYFVLNSRFWIVQAGVYLFSCPACFAKVAFPCLGQWPIIIMFIHLGLLLILLTTVNTAEAQREGAKEEFNKQVEAVWKGTVQDNSKVNNSTISTSLFPNYSLIVSLQSA